MTTTQSRFDWDRHFHYQALPNLDANENLFFTRELEHIIPEMFEFQFARINARRIFPIDRTAGAHSKTITWRQFTKTGNAQIISDYADDIQLVNAKGEEFTSRVRGIAVGAMWSMDEIRAARAVGRPLDRMYAEAARETMMRLENTVAFSGDSNFNLTGLFSAGTNIPSNPAPKGSWTMSLAADDILYDMHYAANTIPEVTGDVEAATTLLLPTSKYHIVASRKHGTDTDRTILSHFLLNSPYIREVIPVRELETLGTGGNPVMVAYNRSPSKLRLQVPLDLEQLAPIQQNLAVIVPYHMKVGGVTIHKPMSIHFVQGI